MRKRKSPYTVDEILERLDRWGSRPLLPEDVAVTMHNWLRLTVEEENTFLFALIDALPNYRTSNKRFAKFTCDYFNQI